MSGRNPLPLARNQTIIPYFNTNQVYPNLHDIRRQQAENIILNWAKATGQVNADDVYGSIKCLFPHNDGRIVGAIFQGLSRKGKIRRVAWVNSTRPNRHACPIPVWELTKHE